MKTRKALTKRVYAACVLLLLGCVLLLRAVQAGPATLQAQSRPSPTPTPAPTPQEVNVVNPATSPVPTRDVDNAARQPFQAFLLCGFNGIGFCSDTFTVPAGKRLVIEFMSGTQALPTSEKAIWVQINVQNSGTSVAHQFPLTLTSDDGVNASFVGAHQTRLYADPSTTVEMDCLESGMSQGACGASISGYLIDVL
jgi:hypothetical protein